MTAMRVTVTRMGIFPQAIVGVRGRQAARVVEQNSFFFHAPNFQMMAVRSIDGLGNELSGGKNSQGTAHPLKVTRDMVPIFFALVFYFQ